MAKKAWEGRFKEKNDPLFERMNRSLSFDIRLYKEDIELNKVYSKELNRLGILSDDEYARVEEGLNEVADEIEAKGLQIFTADTEDIHMGVESLLTGKIGDAARKIHSGKSRNDQVATDFRKYAEYETREIMLLIHGLLEAILELAEGNLKTPMPGYTHLRQAQPVLFSHYIMSFFFAFHRDYQRFADSLKRTSIMPLGSAALAGSSLDLDRENLRKGLGFEEISQNSMDGVLSRDFVLEILSAISILALNLSRMAEDFIIYSSEHFNFFTLSDRISTGSSIMPNKKNPDSLELTRGKTGRILGSFVTLCTVLKAQPSTYNKDLQEDKEAFFDGIDTIKDLLAVTVTLLDTIEINQDVMEKAIDPLAFATELADYLASRSVPFRDAHHTVGKIVLDCVENKVKLTSLTEKQLIAYHESFKGIGDKWGSISLFLQKREIPGGTGTKSVEAQIAAGKELAVKCKENE